MCPARRPLYPCHAGLTGLARPTPATGSVTLCHLCGHIENQIWAVPSPMCRRKHTCTHTHVHTTHMHFPRNAVTAGTRSPSPPRLSRPPRCTRPDKQCSEAETEVARSGQHLAGANRSVPSFRPRVCPRDLCCTHLRNHLFGQQTLASCSRGSWHLGEAGTMSSALQGHRDKQPRSPCHWP